MKKTVVAFFLCFLFAHVVFSQTERPEKAPETQDTTKKIIVFPNPATNVINVLGLANSAKAEFKISDLYGNVVMQHNWEIKNNALNIPIADLDAGIYMITIQSDQQKVQHKFYKK